MTPDVAVVGGGLAGITAALACADDGKSVTLLEGRPRLGGRTASFRRGPLEVDTGQHVFMRCCTSYLRLLDRLGVRDSVHLQGRLNVPVLQPGRRRPARIARIPGPAPLHIGPALARYALLSPARRLKLGRAALALRRVDPTDPDVDEQSFGTWLAQHGQDRVAIERLWDLITVATLNAPARDSSLALAATVFQLGLLTDAAAADLGWARIPLGALHADAADAALTAAGAHVRRGAKVTAIEPDGTGWALTLGGETLDAGVRLRCRDLILAVPPPATERLLPADAVALPAGWSDRLSSSPIVNVHVVYDRPVTSEPFLAAVDSPVQWVFDRTVPSGLDQGQYLAVSLSAARDEIRRPVADLADRIVPALAALLPAARGAHVEEVFVTREPTATFHPAPGTAALRPPPVTRRPGLYLAGSWTATGWPDTMESAVRSGEAAAAAVLRRASRSPAGVPA